MEAGASEGDQWASQTGLQDQPTVTRTGDSERGTGTDHREDHTGDDLAANPPWSTYKPVSQPDVWVLPERPASPLPDYSADGFEPVPDQDDAASSLHPRPPALLDMAQHHSGPDLPAALAGPQAGGAPGSPSQANDSQQQQPAGTADGEPRLSAHIPGVTAEESRPSSSAGILRRCYSTAFVKASHLPGSMIRSTATRPGQRSLLRFETAPPRSPTIAAQRALQSVFLSSNPSAVQTNPDSAVLEATSDGAEDETGTDVAKEGSPAAPDDDYPVKRHVRHAWGFMAKTLLVLWRVSRRTSDDGDPPHDPAIPAPSSEPAAEPAAAQPPEGPGMAAVGQQPQPPQQLQPAADMPARQDSRHGDLQHCAAGSPALSQPTEAAAECQSYEDDTFEAELAGTTADSYQNEAFDDHPELSAAASDDDDLAPAESDATAASVPITDDAAYTNDAFDMEDVHSEPDTEAGPEGSTQQPPRQPTGSFEEEAVEAKPDQAPVPAAQPFAITRQPSSLAAAAPHAAVVKQPAEKPAQAAAKPSLSTQELNRCVLVCLLKNRSKELADMLVKAGPPNGRPILAGAAAICTLAKMASSNKPNFGSQREIKQWTADVNGLLHAAGTSGCLDSLEASPLVSTARACLARLDLGTDAAAAMQSGSLEALKRAAGKAAAQQNVPLMRQMKAEIARQGRLGKSVPSQTQAPLPANKAASGRLQARLTPEALAKLRKHDAEQAKVWREWKASKDAQARANRQEDQKRSEHRRAQQHKCLEGAQRRSQAGFASWTNAKHAELLCKTTQRELLNYTRKRDAEKQQFQEVYLADSNTVREQNWRMGSARSGRTDGRAVATARSHHTVPVQLKVSQTA